MAFVYVLQPQYGRSEPQDSKSNQSQKSDQDQDKNRAEKKADIPHETAQDNHISTPMHPVSKTLQEKDVGSSKDAAGNETKTIKMPFAVGKQSADSGQKTGVGPNVAHWKVKDLGDSVRFEFSTPMGPNVWIKKKSELTDEEKQALANATPASPAAETPKK